MDVVNPGNGFGQNPPTITITGGGGSGAQATPVLDENGTLLSVNITNPGFGYLSPPVVSLSPSNGAVVTATIDTTIINEARSIAGTNRWVLDWAPQSPGTYNISVEAIDEDLGSTKISTDRWVVITPKSSSMVPTVKLNGPDTGQTYTSGSKLYFYSQADDLDGTLDWVRFYVNGDPYGDRISAYLGKSSANYPYGVEWEVPAPGVYSIFAVAMDNSGNGIMSGISTITATTGEGSLPMVEFTSPLDIASASANISGDGKITSINLNSGGFGYSSVPSVIINGGNGDATATASIETNTSNPYFGQVRSIVVDNNGSGYDTNTTIRLLGGFPKVKPSGEPAIARLDFAPIPKFYVTIIDGGSGYVSVPDVVIDGAGTGMTAEAFINDSGEVYQVVITNQGEGYLPVGNTITFQGGFVFSETSLLVEASDPDGAVEQVILYENGVKIADDAIAPFNFIWESGAMGYYDLTAEVIDNQGNKNVSHVLRRDVFYSDPPTIELQPISPATFDISTAGGIITDVNIAYPGYGYHTPPQLIFEDTNGSGADFVASIDENGRVDNISLVSGGSNYTNQVSVRASRGLDTILSNYRLDFGKSLAIGVYADDEDSIIDPEAFKVFVNGVHEPILKVSGSTPNYSLT